MDLRDLYRRYRRWAAQVDGSRAIALGAGAGGIAAGVLGLVGSEWRSIIFWNVLPWLVAIAIPIAAFDAWGAAMERGAPVEARVRALIILLSGVGLAGGILLAR